MVNDGEIRPLCPACKMDILLSMKKKGYNLKDTENTLFRLTLGEKGKEAAQGERKYTDILYQFNLILGGVMVLTLIKTFS